MMGKSVFEGYWLDDRVGEGAFGTVYRIVKQDETGTYTRALKAPWAETGEEPISTLRKYGKIQKMKSEYSIR